MLDSRVPIPEDEGADEVYYALDYLENLAIFHERPVPIKQEQVVGMDKEAALRLIFRKVLPDTCCRSKAALSRSAAQLT